MENEYPEGRVLSAGEPTGKKLFEPTRVGIRQDLASIPSSAKTVEETKWQIREDWRSRCLAFWHTKIATSSVN